MAATSSIVGRPWPEVDPGERTGADLRACLVRIGFQLPIYARLHNPTVGRFERALAQLEGTEAAVAFGSGMAAITACLLAARADGEHVVALRPLYGGTDALLASGLLGLDVSWARAGAIRGVLRPATSLVLLETPQNPTLGLVDIAAVVDGGRGDPRARRQHVRDAGAAEPRAPRRVARRAQRDEVSGRPR